MADFLFLALTGKKPTAAEARPLQILIGLLISNGPGAITAQGAKGAVSADGPQTPSRVQINKAMVGFLTHPATATAATATRAWLSCSTSSAACDLKDPTDPNHGLDLNEMAMRSPRPIGRKIAIERVRCFGVAGACRVCTTRSSRASPSTTIRASALLRSSWRSAATTISSMPSTASWSRRCTTWRDAVRVLRQHRCHYRGIAAGGALEGLQVGALAAKDLETAAFNVFLYGRMIGAAAEIDDHLNRGRNMDTRTPQEQCSFVVCTAMQRVASLSGDPGSPASHLAMLKVRHSLDQRIETRRHGYGKLLALIAIPQSAIDGRSGFNKKGGPLGPPSKVREVVRA